MEKSVLPDILVGGLRFEFLALLNILRELCESAIEALFVGIVVFPLLSSLGTVLRVIVLGLVGLALSLVGLIVRCEGCLWMVETIERFEDLCFMD